MSKSPLIVQKFGGTSLATPEMIKRVARRILHARERGERVLVVVSAMGDTTDRLTDLARAITSSPSRRELDMLLTAGERISMALLSMALNDFGHEAISFTGSQSGIVTDTTHTKARILQIRAQRIEEELERDRIVIVAGFQGVSQEREVTTLGRGGSDTSAVALAIALDADRCEIYSDVEGLYTADPRRVQAARLVPYCSHDEMAELAGLGAPLLHFHSARLARESEIPLFLKGTFTAHPGTEIGPDPPQGAPSFCSTSALDRLTVLKVAGEGAVERAGRLIDGLESELSAWGFLVGCDSERGAACHLVLDESEADLTRPRVEEAFDHRDLTYEEQTGLGCLSFVGWRCRTFDPLRAALFEILAEEGVEVRSHEVREHSISLLLDKSRLDTGLRKLHDRLCAEGLLGRSASRMGSTPS